MEPSKHLREMPPPFGVKADIGKRKNMEDTHCVHENFMDIPIASGASQEIIPSHVQHAMRPGSTRYRGMFPDWLIKQGSLLWHRAVPRSLHKGSDCRPESGWDACSPDSRTVTLDTFHLFAIFDGHGGSGASEFCAKMLHQHIRTNLGHFLTGHLRSRQYLDTNAEHCEDFARHTDRVMASHDRGPEEAAGLGIDSSIPEPAGADVGMKMRTFHRQEGEMGNEEGQSLLRLADQPVKSMCGSVSAAHSSYLHAGTGSSCTDVGLAHGCADDIKRVPQQAFVRPMRSMSCRVGGKLLALSTRDVGTNLASHRLGKKYPSFSGLCPLGISSHEMGEALSQSFLQTDLEFARDRSARDTGTTALVALVSSEFLCFCNCGDSRGVLFRESRAMRVTRDHTPACDDERRRIAAQGGHIFQLHNDGPRVMGVLAMTRAIGDTALRPFVIADPEVTILRRSEVDEFFILATDGLWEVMSDKDVCVLVKKSFDRAKLRGTSSQAAAKLAASVVCRAAIECGAQDNITAIVVDLRMDGKE